MSEIFDDKSPICIPFIVEQLKNHEDSVPFFIGLNGIQGAGKTILVKSLTETLSSPPYSIPTLAISIDDYYLPYTSLQDLAKSHPSNPLLQHRGQPSTHDINLLQSNLGALTREEPTKIPVYDKSAYQGRGDRLDESEWIEVNGAGQPKIKIIIFEGWCVGFRPLLPQQLQERWQNAVSQAKDAKLDYPGRLGHVQLDDVTVVNKALDSYAEAFRRFDTLIHLDAEDPLYVYAWRQDQETELWKTKGRGMSEEQVKRFIDGYYPSYELYLDGLRSGFFGPSYSDREESQSDREQKRQLRLIIGKDRKVKDYHFI
ncbi:hypothetical protein MMC25_001541 [Agyrium rufum]|nr:hypothetical protein [Agyrium rufum]